MSKEVIARRELEFVTSSDRETVLVELRKPVKEKDGTWLCHYLIKCKSFSKEFRMAGEDSMQALILVLKIIPVELDALAKKHNGHFTWFEGSDLGFISHT